MVRPPTVKGKCFLSTPRPKADPAGAPITAVAGHLGDMRTYAHWLRDERRLPAALLDQMFAIRNT
jgi:hypothetical protein